MNNSKRLLSSVSYVMIIMIFSRLLALVSTQVYMSFYGLDSYLNIYSYAITVPNTIFNCFGTALSTVVIPIYAGHLANDNRLSANKFADNIITISTVITLILVLFGIAISPIIVKLTAFTKPGEYEFAVKALMVIMPVMLFYGLNYIFQGMLQSNGKYGWPAFVSVPSSLVVIVYVFAFGDRFGISGLLVATLIGLAMQAIILIPPLLKTGYRYHPSFSLRDSDIISAGKMTLNVLVGVSAYQINMFYNVTMISNFEGMTTLLTYVQNIVVYMVLAFIYSITAVLYPKLTEKAAKGDMQGYKESLNTVLSNVMLLLVPITVGFIVVRQPLLQLIANWGKITDADIFKASIIVIMYSVGIVGIGAKEILDRAFYAIKDTKTPAVNGFVVMGVNIALSLVLMKLIGAYGIPLAYSVACLTGTAVLMIRLNKKIGAYLGGFFKKLLKSVICASVMGIAAYGTLLAMQNVLAANGIFERLLTLFVPVGVGVIVYGIMLLIMRVDVAVNAVDKILRKRD